MQKFLILAAIFMSNIVFAGDVERSELQETLQEIIVQCEELDVAATPECVIREMQMRYPEPEIACSEPEIAYPEDKAYGRPTVCQIIGHEIGAVKDQVCRKIIAVKDRVENHPKSKMIVGCGCASICFCGASAITCCVLGPLAGCLAFLGSSFFPLPTLGVCFDGEEKEKEEAK